VLDLWLHNSQSRQQRFICAISDTSLFDKWLCQLHETLKAHRKNMLTIQPKTFVQIKNRIAAINLIDVKDSKNLLHRELLAIVARRPTEQAEVIHHSLWSVAMLHEIRDTRSPIALTELLAFVIQNERNMAKDWGFLAERVVKFDMLRCVGKVILTTNDMCEFHLNVIDNIHKMKNPGSIGTADRHVRMGRRIRHIKLNTSANHILDDHRFARRTKTDRPAIFVHMPSKLQAS
jgi:hypothetical protein